MVVFLDRARSRLRLAGASDQQQRWLTQEEARKHNVGHNSKAEVGIDDDPQSSLPRLYWAPSADGPRHTIDASRTVGLLCVQASLRLAEGVQASLRCEVLFCEPARPFSRAEAGTAEDDPICRFGHFLSASLANVVA
ncbi:hypothetical protein OC844_006642 [Tilletia horrida]|nr:hypothetical protein OC844_006642 [Tilletia horrida]